MKNFHFMCLGLIALVFWSCGSPPQASTEVENELKVSYLTGTAATGLAVVNANWQLSNAQGIIIAQGLTNSLGQFSWPLDSMRVPNFGAWLMRVYWNNDSLLALVALDSSSVQGDSLFVLVNTVTSAIADSLRNRPQAWNLDSINFHGEKLVNALLGNLLTWDNFYRDRSYRPALDSMPAGYAPNRTDMILHSLQSQASAEKKSVPEFLQQWINLDSSLADNHNFQMELAGNMALYGVPPEEAHQILDHWNNEISDHYEQLRGLEEQLPGIDSMRNLDDPWLHSMELANRSLSSAIQQLSPMEMLSVQSSFSVGVKYIADILYRQMKDDQGGYYAARFWEDLSLGISMSLLTIKPAVWVSDPLATQELIADVTENHWIPQLQSGVLDVPSAEIKKWSVEAQINLETGFSHTPW